MARFARTQVTETADFWLARIGGRTVTAPAWRRARKVGVRIEWRYAGRPSGRSSAMNRLGSSQGGYSTVKRQRFIGPVGTLARVVAGASLIALGPKLVGRRRAVLGGRRPRACSIPGRSPATPMAPHAVLERAAHRHGPYRVVSEHRGCGSSLRFRAYARRRGAILRRVDVRRGRSRLRRVRGARDLRLDSEAG